jgi:hypothetical protein
MNFGNGLFAHQVWQVTITRKETLDGRHLDENAIKVRHPGDLSNIRPALYSADTHARAMESDDSEKGEHLQALPFDGKNPPQVHSYKNLAKTL